MAETEFIIALTEHRYFGSVFVPYLIEKEEQFYTVKRHIKPRDLENNSDYSFKPYERELVGIIEKYSDENLTKKFSRAGSVSEFFSSLKPGYFEKNVTPYIEKQMFKVASILMLCPVRLLKKETKYANLYDEDEIFVQPVFANPVFYFERTEKETHYRLKVYLDKNEITLKNSKLQIICNEPCLMIHRSRLIVFEEFNAKKMVPFFEKEKVTVPHSIEEKYYSGFVLNTIRDNDVFARGFKILEEDLKKRAVLSLEKNLKQEPCFVLHFYYGDEKFLPNSNRKVAVNLHKRNDSYVFEKVKRNFVWENTIQNHLKEAGLKENNGSFLPKGYELFEHSDLVYFLVNWINRHKHKLEANNIHFTQSNLEKKYFTGDQQLEMKAKTSGDWFDVYATVRFGEFQIPFIKLKKYILNDIREFELPNGEIAVLPDEWFARYKGLVPFSKGQGEKLQFEKHHFMLLKNGLQQFDKSVMERFQKMEATATKGLSLPANLKAKLRAYQEEGFQWMFHLYKNGFGGCLADDMGLGKTLQTLSLLLKLKRNRKKEIEVVDPTVNNGQLDLFGTSGEEENNQPASLIVLPTSLVHNWDNEIRKFTPALKAYKHIGIQRKKAVDLGKITEFYDIVLTTYGTVRNDIEILSKTEFFYIILDESQFIKNSTSKTYKAVMKLRSQHRLVLTGTPIENSLSDLWSQMNFLNKGVLGNLAFFRNSFITPIEKHKSQEQQEKLQLLIRPFILRRKKEEVAKDLPPLVEQVRVCEMSKEQSKLYEHEKSVIRNTILENIEKEGMEKSGLVILQGLTKLRQLANHPSLMEKENEESSGKFDEIFRMLENLVAENHKVLIFSSFVKHLELLQEKIEKQKWKYSLLTGQTSKREEVIQSFQNDPDNRIFLISLKAGGVGLNLTEADYVFIIDPWWNPAAENQAINRAHRIGQDKHVFVYRFITEDSIEEKIQQLQEHKSSLADKFINSNNPFQKISKEEIVALFK
ncbi:ATP-dependent helicase [Maribellus comscasis]|uniref:ATP-dependent helicase n=1 Tax=Maribellus comscasis TaxID=2681766 RepID=A0A6I6JJG5_9BACT|nr:DEAD/DEAH box helicase [Maribellus comscasis]QGY42411.1 ATP-dependent helicase [Maribellus comscasis]